MFHKNNRQLLWAHSSRSLRSASMTPLQDEAAARLGCSNGLVRGNQLEAGRADL